MLFMEEYKSLMRFANLCLYFSGGQPGKSVGILREKHAKQRVQEKVVGAIGRNCGKGCFLG
jgi:hypothetical protein